MSERIVDGVRIKFAVNHLGARSSHADEMASSLSAAIRRMDELGMCPVLDDGLAAGNAALRLSNGALLVSPSGRRPGTTAHELEESLVEVVAFAAEEWSGTHRGDPSHRPTSDTPLHWLALLESDTETGWQEQPMAALHGHVLDTDRAADVLGLPISREATEFSTPADRDALRSLFRTAPYPEHRVWIRRGHGFFLLGASLDEACGELERLAERRDRANAALGTAF